MAWVPPGDRGQQPAALGARQGRGQSRRRPRRARDRRGPLRASSTPPSRSSSSTTRCPVVTDIEEALKDGAPLVHAELGTNKCHEWSLGGGDLDAQLRGSRRDRRAPGRQPPHGGRGDRAARRAGRLPRRRAHAALLDPGPALPAPVPRRSSWASARTACARSRPRSAEASAPSCRSTARRSRWRGRPASSSGRSSGSSRARRACWSTHHGRDQIAYVRVGATRDGKITAFHTQDPRRLRRLPDAADADDPVARRVRDERLYDIPAVQTDIIGVFTNKISTDAIRGAGRPEATHMIEVMHRPARGRAGHGPARAAPARTSWTRTMLPARDRARRRLRLRQLPGRAGQAARARRRREGARRGREAPDGQAARRRLLDLHRDLRPGAVSASTGPPRFGLQTGPVGVGDGARAHHRRGHRLHRHLPARAGAGDDDGADRRRPARHRPARTSRSSTATPAPGRRAWAPTARARPRSAASPSPARRPRSSTRRARSSPTSSRRRRTTSSSTGGKFSVKGSPDKGMTHRRGRRRGLHPGEHARRAWSRGWRSSRSTTRRTSCSRSARTRAWSTWIRRPATSTSCATSRVDDCGPAINPKLIDGQVHGGIVHAIGQALFERIHYNEDGQLVTEQLRRLRAPERRRRALVRDSTAPRPRRRSTRSASRASARRARSPPRPRSPTPSSTPCARSASRT